MAQSKARPSDIRSQHPLWDERDAFGRRAMLTEFLAQVSHEALYAAERQGRDCVVTAAADAE